MPKKLTTTPNPPSPEPPCSAACRDIDWVIDKLKTHIWMTERAPKNPMVLPTGAQMGLLISRLEIAKLRLLPNDKTQRRRATEQQND